jgi:hypothetical protein
MSILRVRLLTLIGAVVSLTVGAIPASAGQPAFCQGKQVPEQYFGRVTFAPKAVSVVRGGHLYVRLFNGLGRPIAFGHKYWEQRYVDGTWVAVPSSSSPGGGAEPIQPPASRLRLGARSAGPCIDSKLDAERSPGKYRLIAEVYINLQPGAKSRFRAAEFTIENRQAERENEGNWQ